jgi:dipeptidase E
MKKLFLASYFTEVASLLPDFVGEDLTGRKVVFIPTAALYEEEAFYVDTDREALQKLGLIVEDLEVSSASCEAVEKSITNADYIFVGGGNTFFLLQELRRKGADKLIAQHIEKGKLYIGTSAGSLLLQKGIVADGVENLELAPDLNGDFSALSIIDFYLYVHYGHNYFGNDDQLISTYYDKLDFKRISDKQVVTVDGEKIEIVTAP